MTLIYVAAAAVCSSGCVAIRAKITAAAASSPLSSTISTQQQHHPLFLLILLLSTTSTSVVPAVEGSPIQQGLSVPGAAVTTQGGGIDEHPFTCQGLLVLRHEATDASSVGHILSPVTENGTLPIQELSCSWLIQVPSSPPPLSLAQRQQQQTDKMSDSNSSQQLVVTLSFAKFDLDDDDDEEEKKTKRGGEGGNSNGGSSMCSGDHDDSSSGVACCRDTWLSIASVPASTTASLLVTMKPVEAEAQKEAIALAAETLPSSTKGAGGRIAATGVRGQQQKHIFCGRSLSLPPLLFVNPSSIVVTLKKKKTTTKALQRGSKGFAIDYIIGQWRQWGNCGEGQFHCANGKCVLDSWLCNGWDECGDSSDERDCAHSPPPSPPSAATTRRGLGSWSRPIVEQEYTNNSSNSNSAGPKISAALGWCSGRNQLACRSTTTYQQLKQLQQQQKIGGGRGEGEADEHLIDFGRLALLPSPSSPECYSVTERCDGLRHCTDGSDEVDCGGSGGGSDCSPQRDAFLCLNGRCIPAINRCDGLNDCGDASDEDGCLKSSVIAAVILGSLICGLLLVIAAGCGIRLYHLRKTLERRWSLIRLQQQQNNNNNNNSSSSSHQQQESHHGVVASVHQQLLQHSHRHRSSSIDGEYDEFGRRRPVMGRLPPPTYAAAVLQQQQQQQQQVHHSSQEEQEGGEATSPFAPPSTPSPVVQVQLSSTSDGRAADLSHRSRRTTSRHGHRPGSNTSRVRRPAPPPPPPLPPVTLIEVQHAQEQMTAVSSPTAVGETEATATAAASSSSSSFGRRLVNRFLSAASYTDRGTGRKEEELPLPSAIAASAVAPPLLPSGVHQTVSPSSSPACDDPSPSSSSSSSSSLIMAGDSSTASRSLGGETNLFGRRRARSVIQPSTMAASDCHRHHHQEEEEENTGTDTDTDTEPLLLSANCDRQQQQQQQQQSSSSSLS